jgi:hypothetical protein
MEQRNMDSFATTLVGFVGVIVGALATTLGPLLTWFITNRGTARAEKTRKELLLKMLRSGKHSWRRLTTLSSVIGSTEDATKELLLQVGARASEDGEPLWALIERHPLAEITDVPDIEQ